MAFAKSIVSLGKGAFPCVAPDASGKHLHIVYYRDEFVWHRAFHCKERKLSDEVRIGFSHGRLNRNHPRITCTSDGVLHVFAGYFYRRGSGQSWMQMGDKIAERDSAMACDSQGNLFVCGRGGNQGGHICLRKLPAGSQQWTNLPDPDIAAGFAPGGSHPYGHVFSNLRDDSIHVVYRQGTPLPLSYRCSYDGGRSWQGCGISDDKLEQPCGACSPSGRIHVIGGNGTFYVRESHGGNPRFKSIARPLIADRRNEPTLHFQSEDTIYAACFGGRYNIGSSVQWGAERKIEPVTSGAIGFTRVYPGPANGVVLAWQEIEGSKEQGLSTGSMFFNTL